ncbi:MAG: hypothetical protein RLZZ182_1022 [Pseudomonadota bacterium]|jgi:hypothetical protein
MAHVTPPHSADIDRRQALLGGLSLVGGMATSALPATAWAQNTATRFANYVRQGNTELLLNGKGTRTKMFVKVYDMALYTPQRVQSANELLTLPGPKRLSMVSLRSLKTADIGLMFVKGMKANCEPEVIARYTTTVSDLIRIFSFRSVMDAGVNFSMEFEPGKGTAFVFNGQQVAERVGDDAFFANALKIWFGRDPADPDLAQALLGKA